VRIITPLKRDAIKARPVVAMEDVAASKRLEDLGRSYGLEVEQEHVPLTGEVDLNRPGLIGCCCCCHCCCQPRPGAGCPGVRRLAPRGYAYGGFGGGHLHFHPHTGCRKRHSTLRVNGRETHALSSSAGHFAAQRLRVSLVRTNQHAAPDPGSAGILAWR
jgi:hypothetical protein